MFDKLKAPFPPEVVSWRVGSTTADKTKGMALAYIDARDVMERLDDVVGPGNWQCDYPHANGKTVCRIGIRVDGEWVWKADGAGDTDHEAEKGALSDAFKRAAVRWGIGRYLYDLDSPWVPIEQRGKSYVIAPAAKQGLVRLLQRDIVRQAPAETQSKPQDDGAISSYIAAFRMALSKAESRDQVAPMWKEGEFARQKLNIQPNSLVYQELHAEWIARGKELSAHHNIEGKAAA